MSERLNVWFRWRPLVPDEKDPASVEEAAADAAEASARASVAIQLGTAAVQIGVALIAIGYAWHLGVAPYMDGSPVAEKLDAEKTWMLLGGAGLVLVGAGLLLAIGRYRTRAEAEMIRLQLIHARVLREKDG